MELSDHTPDLTVFVNHLKNIEKMNSKIYRCGYCGQPTTDDGDVLDESDTKRVKRIITEYGDHHTIKTHGECCLWEWEEQREYLQIIREQEMGT